MRAGFAGDYLISGLQVSALRLKVSAIYLPRLLAIARAQFTQPESNALGGDLGKLRRVQCVG